MGSDSGTTVSQAFVLRSSDHVTINYKKYSLKKEGFDCEFFDPWGVSSSIEDVGGNSGAKLVHFITGKVPINTKLETVKKKPVTDSHRTLVLHQIDAVLVVVPIQLFLKNRNYYTLDYQDYENFDRDLKDEVGELKLWEFLKNQVKEASYHITPIVVLTKVDEMNMNILTSEINPQLNASNFLGVPLGSVYFRSNYHDEEIGKKRIPRKRL